MEIFFIFLAIVFIVGLIGALIEIAKTINWGKVILTFTIGAILLSTLFTFTAEGVFIIIGAFIVLFLYSIISTLITSSNQKKSNTLHNPDSSDRTEEITQIIIGEKPKISDTINHFKSTRKVDDLDL